MIELAQEEHEGEKVKLYKRTLAKLIGFNKPRIHSAMAKKEQKDVMEARVQGLKKVQYINMPPLSAPPPSLPPC
jgi:hypothetical protein